MRVCVVGSGGREHALATVLGRHADSVVVTPGNPGIPGSVATPPGDVDADLWVIGPEQPLVDGLADRLRAAGKLVFGPGADGARLEGSKAWMKEVLVDAGVPTARHGSFTDLAAAKAFMRTLHGGVVVKTDYLAAGKGVLVTTIYDEAVADASQKLEGGPVVIEELLTGPEVSVFALCDGQRAVVLPYAQDHKRVGDGDTGPNTGGMGAFSPVALRGALVGVMDSCIHPTIDALRRRGIDYRGVLFAGLMLTPDGPKVLEYNVRFGDPETQVVLPRLTCDLVQLLAEAAAGDLVSEPTWTDDAAVTVALCSEGYPAAPRLGDAIEGIAAAEQVPGVTVFCAGVGPGGAGRGGHDLVTAGGRVLNVTAVAPTLADARDRAYEAVGRINWPGMHHRTDIARSVT